MRDMLLYGMTQTEEFAELYKWKLETPDLHEFVPDYHRLQLERWIWDRRELLTGRVMDIGVENRRDWVGGAYFTFGPAESDIVGDLLDLPFCDGELDAVVCTEVLEHCKNPLRAATEMHRVLKPGGLLLASSPHVWPWHGTVDYPDYWRFTHEGWSYLLGENAGFAKVTIQPCKWTQEGEYTYDMMRRFECFGMRQLTHAHTGYLAEAIK